MLDKLLFFLEGDSLNNKINFLTQLILVACVLLAPNTYFAVIFLLLIAFSTFNYDEEMEDEDKQI